MPWHLKSQATVCPKTCWGNNKEKSKLHITNSLYGKSNGDHWIEIHDNTHSFSRLCKSCSLTCKTQIHCQFNFYESNIVITVKQNVNRLWKICYFTKKGKKSIYINKILLHSLPFAKISPKIFPNAYTSWWLHTPYFCSFFYNQMSLQFSNTNTQQCTLGQTKAFNRYAKLFHILNNSSKWFNSLWPNDKIKMQSNLSVSEHPTLLIGMIRYSRIHWWQCSFHKK